MSTYALPSVPYRDDTLSLIDPVYQGESPRPLNPTLASYLAQIKTQIDSRQDEWDRCKKLTNPYEYIHTAVPNSKQAVCKHKPLSRSFYKLVEIYNLMSLEDALPDSCKIFYLAEGPGGFIEAMTSMRKENDDQHHAISLVDDKDPSVPGWKKSHGFIERHQNIVLEMGKDNTGNLFNIDTLRDIHERHAVSADLVTADGGVNFSSDFNHQEAISTQLIACQIAYTVAVQKRGGSAIIKFFDTFTTASLDLVYFLLLAYEDVSWVKPCTSRYANSERYAVCRGFRLKSVRGYVEKFCKMLENAESGKAMTRLLTCEIPYLVLNKVEEYNAIFGQQQIESIANTLNLIENPKHDKVDAMKKANIGKCIAWCQKYKLPYNRTIQTTNVFLGDRVSSSY